MSLPNRPSYQKATKSSASGLTPAKRNFPGGVSPVRGLSPVRSIFSGRSQDGETSRSHNNPLFTQRSSDTGERRPVGRAVPDSPSTVVSHASKEFKENCDKQELWKVHVEKTQYSAKTLCTTPGKSTRVGAMQFTTPPKPVVKRKILAENREIAKVASKEGNRSDVEDCPLDLQRSDVEELRAPMVSIEELQKRIQKFLQEEERTSSDIPLSPTKCTESMRRFSGVVCGESSESCVDDPVSPYHPVFAPYSPRPEFLRARTRSPSPATVEERVSSQGDEDICVSLDKPTTPIPEKSTTPTSYDPKNNFLSPRPQFLRYRPLRRLELLRRSADAMLDLDLDSPATDVDSSRNESLKDDAESQEVQSLSYFPDSVESTQESPKVVNTPEERVLERIEAEDIELNLEPVPIVEPQSQVDIVRAPEEATVVAKKVRSQESAAAEEVDNDVENGPEVEEGEVDEDEAEGRSLGLRVFISFARLLSVLGFVALVLVASGSPGLLPTSLHGNELSYVWHSSKFTSPIRGIIQTAEGLWTDSPKVLGYPTSMLKMDTVRANYIAVMEEVKSFDSRVVLNNARALWESTRMYLSPGAEYAAKSMNRVKTWMKEAGDSNAARAPGGDEWDWVPEYDFVVGHDMFNSAQAFEAILAKMPSFKMRSLWSSIFQSYISGGGVKSIPDLLEEEIAQANYFVNVIDSGNSSTCPWPLHVGSDQEILPQPSQVALDTALLETLEDRTSETVEESEETVVEAVDSWPIPVREQVPASEAQRTDGKEEHNGESAVGDEGSSRGSPARGVEDQLVKVVSTDSEVSSEGPDSSQEDDAFKIHEQGDGATWTNPIESAKDLNFPLEEVPNQEHVSGLEEVGEILAVQEFVHPPKETVPQGAPESPSFLDENPKMPLSSFLPGLRPALSLATGATAMLSVIVAVAVAMVLLGPGRKIFSQLWGRSKSEDVHGQLQANASVAQGLRGKLPRKPQRTFKVNTSQPLDTGRNYLPGDSPVPRLSSEVVVEQSLAPNSVPAEGSSKPIRDRDMFLSPERSYKQVSDRDLFATSEIEVVEDSALGRFTALVPVVHNEGTDNEQVKLTPVRRSSRIRSRIQSPCSSIHSSHYSYSPGF